MFLIQFSSFLFTLLSLLRFLFSVDWSSVGGLDGHIRSLKEMIILPLLYPELFQRFCVTPPRGVLFYGSMRSWFFCVPMAVVLWCTKLCVFFDNMTGPGTGKTLVARALANTCSQAGKKVRECFILVVCVPVLSFEAVLRLFLGLIFHVCSAISHHICTPWLVCRVSLASLLLFLHAGVKVLTVSANGWAKQKGSCDCCLSRPAFINLPLFSLMNLMAWHQFVLPDRITYIRRLCLHYWHSWMALTIVGKLSWLELPIVQMPSILHYVVLADLIASYCFHYRIVRLAKTFCEFILAVGKHHCQLNYCRLWRIVLLAMAAPTWKLLLQKQVCIVCVAPCRLFTPAIQKLHWTLNFLLSSRKILMLLWKS